MRCFYLALLFIASSLHSTEGLFYEEYTGKKAPQSITHEEWALITFTQNAIDLSEKAKSKLPATMLSFGGTMTSPRSRHLLNNLCSRPDTRYLEIGMHQGASLISALYMNNINYAYGIDNWCEFGFHESKRAFIENIHKYIPDAPLSYLAQDSFTVDIHSLPKFNVYFYDGGHSPEQQEMAFTYYNDCLEDLFIAIVDDWQWDQVKKGTFRAFSNQNYTILYEKEVALRHKEDVPWRFLYVAVIRK